MNDLVVRYFAIEYVDDERFIPLTTEKASASSHSCTSKARYLAPAIFLVGKAAVRLKI